MLVASNITRGTQQRNNWQCEAEWEMWSLYQKGIIEVQVFPIYAMYFHQCQKDEVVHGFMGHETVFLPFLKTCPQPMQNLFPVIFSLFTFFFPRPEE